MKTALFTLALLFSAPAMAANLYLVDGKFVEQGEAEEAIRKNPKVQVMKINATFVAISPKSGNFKKFDDVSTEQLKKAISAAR